MIVVLLNIWSWVRGKPSRIIAIIVALVAISWVSTGHWLRQGSVKKTEGEAVNAALAETKAANGKSDKANQLQTVRVRQVKAESYQASLRMTGQTEPSKSVDVSAETSGRVNQIHGDIGSMVKKGEILVELDPDVRPAKLAQAQALVRQTEIEYEAAVKLAQKGFQSDTKVAQLEAAMLLAKAQRQEVELGLEKTKIRAPFAGVISQKKIDLGAYLREGSAVVTLMDLNPMVISVQVAEKEMGLINQGDMVDVLVGEAIKEKGKIARMSPQSDARTRTYTVEIEIANKDYHLKSGQTSVVSIGLAAREATKIAPAWLTLSDEGVVGVKLVDEVNQVHFTPVIVLSDQADAMWVAGLPAQASIITVGQEFAKHGQKVVVEADKS